MISACSFHGNDIGADILGKWMTSNKRWITIWRTLALCGSATRRPGARLNVHGKTFCQILSLEYSYGKRTYRHWIRQWRAVHITARLSAMSQWVHSKLKCLIISSIWHHGLRIHTESQLKLHKANDTGKTYKSRGIFRDSTKSTMSSIWETNETIISQTIELLTIINNWLTIGTAAVLMCHIICIMNFRCFSGRRAQSPICGPNPACQLVSSGPRLYLENTTWSLQSPSLDSPTQRKSWHSKAILQWPTRVKQKPTA